MKKYILILLSLCFLTGCPKDKGKKPNPEDIPMNMIL